jgi:bilirubin oxidase
MLTRRDFLKLVAAGAGAITASKLHFLPGYARNSPARFFKSRAAIPGGSLDPGSVNKYVTQLVIPPAMPQTQLSGAPGNVDYYEIAVQQFTQHILPESLDRPATTVWSYGSVNHPGTFNYPAFTIEAKYRRPVRVKWINGLVDGDGDFRPHILPVDPTLHWANPPGGNQGRDSRPDFNETPGPYTGPVPIVTHLHGGLSHQESDGYAEAWYLPVANDIPDDFARTGTFYNFFRSEFHSKFNVRWEPGTATFQYQNDQRAATIWYHDHTLGMTRVNVYAGPAGFFLLRGGPGDLNPGVLPGPAPTVGSDPFGTFYEIPLAVQDRSFKDNAALFYPDTREFFDGFTGPFIPDSDVSPIWNPEFFGDTMVVNGRTWPFLNVEQRRYRLRFLNGCDARFLILKMSEDIPFWQIGNEGGFLPAPVMLDQLLMSPAERADVIVDFTNIPVGTEIILLNLGPDEPFGGGEPGDDFTPANPDTTGQVMQFRVVAATSNDNSQNPAGLDLPAIQPLGPEDNTRQLALIEQVNPDFDIPVAALLGTVADGAATSREWADEVTENPAVGATEVWELNNFTVDAHPIHIHEVVFEVVNRQGITFTDDMGNISDVTLVGDPRPPEAWEAGFKDTVTAYPGEVTRVKAKFVNPGLFVWHCHIVEHEDNEMMRPYTIGPFDMVAAAAVPDEDEIPQENQVFVPLINN